MEEAQLQPMPVQIGEVVGGKYRVDRIIGQGGMGIVVEAMHLELDQPVAIKFLRTDIEEDGTDWRARFRTEARAAAAITSEHAVRVFDVATQETGPAFIVMELLNGEDLNMMLERGPLPVAEACDYLLQACEALAEAHAGGLVHRDLKPPNLFVARRPNGTRIVKVLDFGISKVLPGHRLAQSGRAHTTTRSIKGTPGYMAPEQLKSQPIDPRTDIWSMGVILYELLTGVNPFDAETVPLQCVAVLTSQPAPIRQIRTDVPPELEAVATRCLEKNRANRYQSVIELAMALAPFAPPDARRSVARIRSLLDHHEVAADPAPIPLVQKVEQAMSPSRPATVSSWAGKAYKAPRSKGSLAFVIGVGIVLGLGGAGIAVMVSKKSPPPVSAAPAAAPPPPATTEAKIADVPPPIAATELPPAPSAKPVASVKVKPGPAARPSAPPPPATTTATTAKPTRPPTEDDQFGGRK
jgi:serine/threonine-protein kinase